MTSVQTHTRPKGTIGLVLGYIIIQRLSKYS
uniref:Uncharacterized protein n=1 Tax=Anguilla anguilla TaxID=7936 RepID=A0A0E9PDN2_ANGAN